MILEGEKGYIGILLKLSKSVAEIEKTLCFRNKYVTSESGTVWGRHLEALTVFLSGLF